MYECIMSIEWFSLLFFSILNLGCLVWVTFNKENICFKFLQVCSKFLDVNKVMQKSFVKASKSVCDTLFQLAFIPMHYSIGACQKILGLWLMAHLSHTMLMNKHVFFFLPFFPFFFGSMFLYVCIRTSIFY